MDKVVIGIVVAFAIAIIIAINYITIPNRVMLLIPAFFGVGAIKPVQRFILRKD